MAPLKVSYSGVRGIVGESLNETVAWRFGAAFVRLMAERATQGPVLLARDTRASGPALEAALLAAMRPAVPDIRDLGVMGTPTVQFAMRPFAAGGAVVVTASHNPAQWNGFKFFLGPENTVLDGAQTRRLFDLYQEVGDPSDLAAATPLPEVTEDGERAIDMHVDEAMALVDAERVRARAFHVGVDTGGGAGARPLLRLLERLGCRVEEVHVARDSEPSPENLGGLAAAVRERGCDLGLAQDLDGDRLALVDDSGHPIGEDYTLALAVQDLLEKNAGRRPAVVKNLSTTCVVDVLVERHGGELVETPVGEINLSRALARLVGEGRVAFGGEGNGGLIIPQLLLGRDSVVAAAVILDHMARHRQTLRGLVSALPEFHLIKVKVPLSGPVDAFLETLAGQFPDGEISRADGLRIRFADRSWVAVRPSNTEPVLRVVAESPSRTWAEETVARIRAQL